MHRQGRGELASFDPEIKQTIIKLRRERIVLAMHNHYLTNNCRESRIETESKGGK